MGKIDNLKPFKPGQSGNPAGYSKAYAEFRRACQERTPQSLAALVKALKNPRTAVAAAEAILDRGWGRPAQPQTGEGGVGAIIFEVVTGVPRKPDAAD